MKKTSIILSIIILIATLSGFSTVDIESAISIENLNKHIDELTSPEYEGRLMGTEGNEMTIDYINNHFSEIGLEPVVGDSYNQTFKGLNITYDGSPVFNVVDDSGNIIDTFIEGVDYRIRLDNRAMSGSFTGNMHFIDDRAHILRNEYRYEDLAVLLDFASENIIETHMSEDEISDRIFYKGSKLLIYPDYNGVGTRDIQLGTKNSWGLSSGLIKLGVDPLVYERLLSYSEQGYLLDVDIPIEFNEIESTNVLGMIKGKVEDYNNIVIATSIDGLGQDHSGNYYQGAADNGASLALFLELSRLFMEEGSRFDSNIIFLGLNGNKLGDRGFDNYFRIEDISPVRSQVIYLDKIGTKGGELQIGTFTNTSTEFKINTAKFNEVLETIEEMDIAANKQEAFFASDYINFRFRGIPALVLTHGSNENIGTLNDNIEILDINKVAEVGNIVYNHINKIGNINLVQELYEILRSTWWLFLIGLILIFIKFYLYEKSFLKNWVQPKAYKLEGKLSLRDSIFRFIKRYIDKPIVSIYLVVMFYCVIMIVHAKQSALLSEGTIISDITVDYIAFIYAIINNIISTGPMLAFLSLYIGPLLVALVVIRLLSEKIKLSKQSNILISVILSVLAMILAFRMFYKYDYALIFPKLLSLPNSSFVAILIVAIYSLLVVYTLSKELDNFNSLKWTVAFLFLFFIFTSIIYSPYLFNKVVMNLRNSGGRIRL